MSLVKDSHQITTTTKPTHCQRPPSINKGTSITQYLYPLIQYPSTCQSMVLQTAGCTMAFNFFRLDSSVKMMLPSFLRSSVPSGKRTWFPKVAAILARAAVPGSTTWRAITSASTMGILEALRKAETVDFPVAMPPVSPITVNCEIGKYQKQNSLRAHRA